MTKKGASKYNNKYPIGHQFGYWKLQNEVTSGTPAKYSVKCICGTEKWVDAYSLIKQKSTSCGCIERTGSLAPNWKGVNGISSTALYRNSSAMSASYTLRPSLTHLSAVGVTGSNNSSPMITDAMVQLAQAQNYTCGITNQPLNFSANNTDAVLVNDSTNRYGTGTQWVHKSIAPIIKASGDIGTFLTIAQSAIQNQVVSPPPPPVNIFEQMGFTKSK